MSELGLIHVYYGFGKGKTTAAFGLALRASGCGRRVTAVQFCKSTPSGEVAQCEKLGITVLRGKACGKFVSAMSDDEKAETKRIHDENLRRGIELGGDMLILDEAMDALSLGLLDEELFYGLLEDKPPELELVITGHEPIERVLSAADYVTEMKVHKHPYERGIPARRGIEF